MQPQSPLVGMHPDPFGVPSAPVVARQIKPAVQPDSPEQGFEQNEPPATVTQNPPPHWKSAVQGWQSVSNSGRHW
jgi:hypothetical protein